VVLSVEPAIGRLFSVEESRHGGPLAALVSGGFWKRRFGASPGAVGSTLRARGKVVTIVGVLPPGFDFPAGTDVWVPRSIEDRLESRSAHNFEASRASGQESRSSRRKLS
jgi:putative ABC transport system permease protein